jgi:hypothetical protein
MNRSKNYSKQGAWLGGLLLIASVAGVSCSSDPLDLSPTDPGGGSGTLGRGPRTADHHS